MEELENSIYTELDRIQNAKSAIRDAIIAKGVEVAEDALIDTFPTAIEQIETGSGDADVYLCTNNAVAGLYTPVGRIYARDGQKAYSLAGLYVLTDPSATGTERVWECQATIPQDIDGEHYESYCARMHYVIGENDVRLSLEVTYPDGTGRVIESISSSEVEPTSPDIWKEIGGITSAPKFVSGDFWTGEKLSFNGSGWQGTGETAQNLVAVGFTPEVGKAYTADTGAIATLYPEPSGPPTASGMSVAKVAEYTPYAPAFNGITEIEVSNIGYVGNEDEGWGNDYSDANGKYVVTEDTYYETDEKKRVYKHESKNYWFMFYDDSEWGNWGYNYWVITPYEGDSEPYSAVVCVEESNFTTGVSEWYNMEYDTPVDVGIATTYTDKPEQPLVLNGYMAGGYDEAEMDWLFTETLIDFTGFDVTPKVGELYNTFGGRLIGNSLGHDPGDMESNAVMYSNPGVDAGVAVQGRIVGYMHKSIFDGVPCVWFDIDAAGEGIGSRESYAYIPLSKTLSLYQHRGETAKPPFNHLSLIGTMYCRAWGNSGNIFFLAKDVNVATGQLGGDSYSGIKFGINFDPNYGFVVQGAFGHPNDYKKYYTAYDGEWMQFAIICDGYTVNLYFNGELRLTATITDTQGQHPAEFNYLFFRQSDGMGELIHFGKMYAFDRVLSEAEIARAYKMMTMMELPAFTGIPSGYKFRASFSTAIIAETGQAPTITGSPEITERQGVPCAYFDGSASVTFAGDVTVEEPPIGYGEYGVTESAWIWLDPEQYNSDDGYDMRQVFDTIFAGEYISWHVIDGSVYDPDGFKVGRRGWNHVAITRSVYAPPPTVEGGSPPDAPTSDSKLYINGNEFERGFSMRGEAHDKITVSTIIAPADDNNRRFVGCVAEAIAYDRVLSEDEIKQLAAQFKEEMKKVDGEYYE